jgi:hypothetical protein
MHMIPVRHLLYLLLVAVLPAACTLTPPVSTTYPMFAPVAGPFHGASVAVRPAPAAMEALPANRSGESAIEWPAAPVASADLKIAQFEPKAAPTAPSETKRWLQTLAATPLLVEPSEDSPNYGTLPSASYVKLLERAAGWSFVMFGGDSEGRAPGPAWVRTSDLTEPAVTPQWARNHQVTQLWRGPVETEGGTWLPQWSWLEVTGEERNGRLQVRTPGDGRYTAPAEGWVAGADLGPVQSPQPTELPRAYPLTLGPDVLRLKVPYRTQIDGTPWAEANCGPTTLAMVLEGRGIEVASGQVRKLVLDAQGIWGNDTGVYMEALAEVAGQYGLRVLGLRDRAGQLRSWSVEEVRAQVQLGRPVIMQVAYRGLPGRERALYGGDHFIVISGLAGEDFLYHDPINSDGLGFDRFMSPAHLQRAMNATDHRYAHAAFALG